MGDDGRRLVTWPTTRVSFARLPDLGRDVVLVRGIEPNMRWRSSPTSSSGSATSWASRWSSPSARCSPTHRTPGRSPSRAPPRTRASCARLHLEPSRYEGPTGIVGVVQDACTPRRHPRAVHLGSGAALRRAAPCPKATLALLRHVEDLLDVPIPLGELPEDARAWERGVDELAAEDTEVAEYVRSLEEAKDPADAPEASGDAIAREFERYLRRRGDEPGPTPRT